MIKIENLSVAFEETLAVNAFDKKVIENSDIDFSDIKITVLGDSLTEASNLSEEDREKSVRLLRGHNYDVHIK